MPPDSVDPSAVALTGEMRAALVAGIPPVLCPAEAAEAARWREVLVEAVDALATAAYPHEAVDLLVAPGAASRAAWIAVESEDEGRRVSFRAPMTPRLLPAAPFARAFGGVDPVHPMRGAYLPVPPGHRVHRLHAAWRGAEARRSAAEASARQAFLTMIELATTAEQVALAWPGARAILDACSTRPTLLDAVARVREVLSRGEAVVAIDTIEVDKVE